MWFFNKAHSCLSGQINSQNFLLWGNEVAARLLHKVKCTAWCAIRRHGIIGPYWFKDDMEKAVTISSKEYIAILSKIEIQKFQKKMKRYLVMENSLLQCV